jgi:hypothetical protein
MMAATVGKLVSGGPTASPARKSASEATEGFRPGSWCSVREKPPYYSLPDVRRRGNTRFPGS